jgi:hypothetical protein
MTVRRIPRPRDPVALAKLIGDIASGQVLDEAVNTRAQRGRAGGSAGGPARAAKLTPERRQDIARVAASVRWKKK